MITKLRNLLTAVACIFAGATAQAQFSGSVDQYPTTGYEGSPIEFALDEVATTLSTDAATLGAAIAEYVAAETPATLLFSANGTEWTAELEAANHGFWMAADGTPVGHGKETTVWYCSPSVDEAFTTLTFNVGQMPSVMKEGDKGQTTITLKFNDKEATFALTLNVIAKPVYEVPEPTLIEKDLNVVGEAAVTVEQYPRGGYDSDAITLELADVVEKLGLPSAGILVDAMDMLLYGTQYNTGDVEEGGGLKKDSLSNEYTANAPGFWLRPVQDANGEETGECASAGWGDADKFFVESFSFNATDNTLTFNLGQYPGSCKDNEEWFAYVYLIYGDKGYRIRITLKLLEMEQGTGLTNYTKVGEETVTVEQEPRDDYSADAVHPDVDAIAAALGCEVSAIGLIALDDRDNFANSTANNGGFWFNDAGTVVAWGNGSMFVEPAVANDYSTLNVGQHPSRAYQVGEEGESYLYFVNGTNYYAYTVKLKIVQPQLIEYGFESVETRSFVVQAIPSASDYPIGDLITIAPETIEAAIGTTTPTLYGLSIDSVATVKGVYSKSYSCDPKPGFWLNADGRVSVWGDANARVGISWVDNSIMRFFQYPNRNSYGDVFKTQLFLVNEETNKMVTLNISLAFVESLAEKEVVGEENTVLPVSTNDYAISIDLDKAAQALGVEVDDLLNPNNYYLRGLTSDGVYGEAVNCETGLSFNLDGGYDAYGDIIFTIEDNGEGPQLIIFCNSEPPENIDVTAQFCFEVNDQQYIYYVHFVSEDVYLNGISDVQRSTLNGQRVYDLQGRQLTNGKTNKGIYITNGRKVVVK